MTLYYVDKQATIEAIKKHGPVAVLSSHAQMALCDRSLINEGPADEPMGTPRPTGFAEMTFTLKGELDRFEVSGIDKPDGQHFSLTASELEALRVS
jgi:hypothetical protein